MKNTFEDYHGIFPIWEGTCSAWKSSKTTKYKSWKVTKCNTETPGIGNAFGVLKVDHFQSPHFCRCTCDPRVFPLGGAVTRCAVHPHTFCCLYKAFGWLHTNKRKQKFEATTGIMQNTMKSRVFHSYSHLGWMWFLANIFQKTTSFNKFLPSREIQPESQLTGFTQSGDSDWSRRYTPHWTGGRSEDIYRECGNRKQVTPFQF